MNESPRCHCGHRLYDHLGPRGRCNEGTKQCGCSQFYEPEGETVQYENVEIPRDGYGRPMIMPAGRGKKRIPYRRCTTFVGCLDDQSGLIKWKSRQVAYGMGQRKDLVLAAAAADPEDKRTLGDVAEKAAEHAQGSSAATTGTALHALTERIDRGQPLGVIPTEYEADIEAYRAATKDIEFLGIETFRVHDEWQIAGTADRVGIWRGIPTIMDIKTGSVDYPHKMAMQLAMYARSVPYDIATDTRGSDAEPVSINTGVIIHLPAGQGRCTLYEIDLVKGWGACLIARQVWSWRGTKGLTREVDPHDEPPAPPTWASLIAAAASLDDLRLIWKRAAECGALTAEVQAAATEKSRELAA